MALTAARGVDGVAIAAAVATLICAAPAMAVIGFALAPNESANLDGALLRDGIIGTLALMLVGGVGAIAVGAISAWLVSLCDFPGRRWFEWLLVLPLAAPSYVLAYSYASFTWAGGVSPIPVSGFWGVAFIYAVGLYPYVYLAGRAAFASQSACALEAARTLGAKPMALFTRVAAPLARPAIAAGGALVLMEIAADYGAAQHFGVTTLSTAIFRAWYAHANPHAALQISAVLLIAALVFLIIERRARGRAAYAGGSTRWRTLPRYKLNSVAGVGAALFCAALITFGAALPLAWLARLALLHARLGDIAGPFVNSLTLSAIGAAVTLTLALAIASFARRAGRLGKGALFAAGIGYAAPGAVIALGALTLFGLAREAGWVGGLGAGLALTALIWTYAARFTAAGAGPIDSGLARLSKNLDSSARTLGAGPITRTLRIDLPIAAPSLAAAALILFVEILKELPATLVLRPFDFDTLAVIAYAYASDERLLQAAAPALLIFVAGLAPVLILTRGIGRARAGAQ
ncbi:ferric iron ABC transporter permease protein [alpha proteobacterium U9-1i]|nr:ferric iron ABC transporter permease protein [alpha proteobacterium U9-1i]